MEQAVSSEGLYSSAFDILYDISKSNNTLNQIEMYDLYIGKKWYSELLSMWDKRYIDLLSIYTYIHIYIYIY